MPQGRQPTEEQAEGVFGIRLSHRPKRVGRQLHPVPDTVQPTIMRKEMHLSAQFADKRMGIGEAGPAGRRIAHMRHDTGAFKRLLFDEPHEPAVTGGLGLLDKQCVTTLVIGHSPTGFVGMQQPAMFCKRVQRIADVDWF